ncbi:MAG: hypothetical protein QXO40_04810 [Candidatus Aenigmatarchaeota archaeon]
MIEFLEIIAAIITINSLFYMFIKKDITYLKNDFKNLRNLFKEYSENFTKLISSIISNLWDKGIIFKEIMEEWIKFNFYKINEKELISENPLTEEEKQKLKYYLEKGRKGESFTKNEVLEFEKIVKKLEKEKPDNLNVLLLSIVVAFLVGMFLGKKLEE